MLMFCWGSDWIALFPFGKYFWLILWASWSFEPILSLHKSFFLWMIFWRDIFMVLKLSSFVSKPEFLYLEHFHLFWSFFLFCIAGIITLKSLIGVEYFYKFTHKICTCSIYLGLLKWTGNLFFNVSLKIYVVQFFSEKMGVLIFL